MTMISKPIARITAAICVLGIPASVVFYDPSLVENGVKDILMMTLGGALAFLFAE